MKDKPQELNTNWRKVASTIYRKPRDSKIYGSVDIDVTDLEQYITEKRKKGVKTTLTQLITLIVGRAFRDEVPEFNTYLRKGKIVSRNSVDAMVSILLKSGEMSSITIKNTDLLNVNELAEKIAGEINATRQGEESQTMQSKDKLSSLPWPFRSWLFSLYKTVTIDLGFSFPWIKLNPASFGSYVVSNIGTLGLDTGYGALMPSANVSIVLIIGKVYKKPVVINDEVVPRRIFTLSATLDHRMVDGYHGGKLFRYIKYLVKNPHLLEKKPVQ